MTAPVRIREFVFDDDYERVLELWRGIETGIRVGPSDSPGEIKKKLGRDPDLFLVAELSDEIIATVIGGFDGRRGLIHHLPVRNNQRRRGVGQALLSEVETRLRAKGCIKCLLVVTADNFAAMRFYEECGWNSIPEDRVFAKNFS